jgi:hypothetical protein
MAHLMLYFYLQTIGGRSVCVSVISWYHNKNAATVRHSTIHDASKHGEEDTATNVAVSTVDTSIDRAHHGDRDNRTELTIEKMIR